MSVEAHGFGGYEAPAECLDWSCCCCRANNPAEGGAVWPADSDQAGSHPAGQAGGQGQGADSQGRPVQGTGQHSSQYHEIFSLFWIYLRCM